MPGYVIPSLLLSGFIIALRKVITYHLSAHKYVTLNKFYSHKFGWRYAGVFIVSYRASGTFVVMHGKIFGMDDSNAGRPVFFLNPDCFRSGSVTMLKTGGRLYLLTGKL